MCSGPEDLTTTGTGERFFAADGLPNFPAPSPARPLPRVLLSSATMAQRVVDQDYMAAPSSAGAAAGPQKRQGVLTFGGPGGAMGMVRPQAAVSAVDEHPKRQNY